MSKAGFMLLLLPLLLPAAVEATQMPWGVVGSGAGHQASANYGASCTIGQMAVGVMDGSEYGCGGGFWYLEEEWLSDVEASDPELPACFDLRARGANPNRDRVQLQFAVPAAAQVSIRLHDVSGRSLRTFHDGPAAPGYHQLELSVLGLPSGVYFCRMEAPGFRVTRRLVLLR